MKILQRTAVHCEEHIAEINGKKILFRRFATVGFGKDEVCIVIRAIDMRTHRDIHFFESTRPH